MPHSNKCLIFNQSTIDIVDENTCVTLLSSLPEYGFSDSDYHHAVASINVIDACILVNPAYIYLTSESQEKEGR